MIKRFWMGILTILCSIGITIAISYAWFVNGYDVDPLATGSSKDAYYYSGDGSSEKPFIITNARHLYNLAWLQYLGYYNKPSEVTYDEGATSGKYKTYYFQLGIDEEHPVTLDMSNWPLPPIGTTKYPFIGNFNGNGSTIENLTTTNKFSEFGTKHPSTVTSIQDCNVIGFFGSVGAYGDIINATVTNEQNTVGDNNAVGDFNLKNTTVHTSVSETCLGVVAGYVNATVEDVAISKAGLNIDDNASNAQGKDFLSEYATVGYAEEQYITAVSKRNTIVYNPTTSGPTKFTYKGLNGDSTGWGGSIAMSTIYSKLKLEWNKCVSYSSNAKKGTNTQPAIAFPTAQTVVYDDNGNIVNTNVTSSLENALSSTASTFSAATYSNGNYNYRYTYSTTSKYIQFFDINKKASNNLSAARYSLLIEDPDAVAGSEWRFMCLTGYAERKMASQLTLTENKLRTTQGYKISNNGNYLSLGSYNNGGYFNIINETDSDEATIWIKEGNYIYTWFTPSSSYNPTNALPVYTNGEVYNSIKYYLYNSNGNLRATTNTSTWNISANKYKNGNYYLLFNNTNWVLEASTSSYYITYNGNYLSINDNGTLNTDGVTNINDATLWAFSNNGTNPSGYISATLSNNNTYYLRYYNGLTVTNVYADRTNWSNDGNGIYYSSGGAKNYIQYDSNIWKAATCVQKSGYYIYYSSNYLTADLSTTNGITNSTSKTNATIWYFSNTTNSSRPSGRVYTIINGVEYSLNTDIGNSKYPYISTETYTEYSYTGSKLTYSSGTYEIEYYTRWNTYSVGYYNNSVSIELTYSDDYANTPLGNLVNPVGSIITETNNQDISYRSSQTLNSQDSHFTTPDTYIPLQSDDDGLPTSKNTGYIVSGAQYYSDAYGDIRISAYPTSDSLTNCKNGSGNSATYLPENKIHTIGASGDGVFGTNYNKTDFAESGKKFEDTLTSMRSILNETVSAAETTSGYVYGLHFMGATISSSFLNHKTTIPYAYINGTAYYDYEVPSECIDFNLKEKGYINFLAGTYYAGNVTTDNNSFFALYDIFRKQSNPNQIENIQEIVEIYKYSADDSYGYVYKYNDNTYSIPFKYVTTSSGKEKKKLDNSNYDEFNRVTNDAPPSGYSVCFRTSWIKKQNSLTNYTAYYFEIPINDGEYCLGSDSTSGAAGAYLMYLDLSANAQEIYRTKVSQKVTITTDTLKYPNGISVIGENEYDNDDLTLDPSASVNAYITTNNKGNISISKKDNDSFAIVGGTNKVSISTYIPSNKVLYSSTSEQTSYTDADRVIPTSTAPPLSSQDILYMTYIDYNKAEKDSYITTIKQVGTGNSSTKSYLITNTNFETEEENVTIEGNLWNLFDDQGNVITINNIGTLTTTGTTRIVQYEYYSNIDNTFDMFVTTNVNSNTYLASPTGNKITVGPTANEGYEDQIKVVFKDGAYVIYINGTEVSQGNNYDIVFGENDPGR